MSRSIYGSYKGSRPIYGLSSKRDTDCICLPEVSPVVGLRLLYNYLEVLKITVQRFYDAAKAIAPIEADMTMRAVVSTPVFMRLRWIEENPGVKFNKANPSHMDGLKFIYNVYNRDWRRDPLFR